MQAKTFYLNCRNQGVDITYDEVVKLREDWFRMWPEMNLYVQGQVDRIEDASKYQKKKKKPAVEETEEVEDQNLTVDEVVREAQQKKITRYKATNLVGITRVDATKQAALNFPFQSLAAVISKRALWLVFLDSQDRGYKLINFIHEQ